MLQEEWFRTNFVERFAIADVRFLIWGDRSQVYMVFSRYSIDSLQTRNQNKSEIENPNSEINSLSATSGTSARLPDRLRLKYSWLRRAGGRPLW